uniref:ORF5a protein n=1 Tax=Mikumi yellow baboon virus 1 TaxID=1546177 RepID=A0A089G1E2_9NIDO|nr:ORF5a protein [Mikumi yellow baboon virus 1]
MLQELGAFLDAFAINFIVVYLLVAIYICLSRRHQHQSLTRCDFERHF